MSLSPPSRKRGNAATKSTTLGAGVKPGKPYSNFPLTIHPSGRFSKKLRGKLYYFGRWATAVGGELQHALERASIVSTDGKLRFDLVIEPHKTKVPPFETSAAQEILTDQELRQLEANNISTALNACKGKIYGTEGAAALLGMKPTTLASRIKALGINR